MARCGQLRDEAKITMFKFKFTLATRAILFLLFINLPWSPAQFPHAKAPPLKRKFSDANTLETKLIIDPELSNFVRDDILKRRGVKGGNTSN